MYELALSDEGGSNCGVVIKSVEANGRDEVDSKEAVGMEAVDSVTTSSEGVGYGRSGSERGESHLLVDRGEKLV